MARVEAVMFSNWMLQDFCTVGKNKAAFAFVGSGFDHEAEDDGFPAASRSLGNYVVMPLLHLFADVGN